MYKLIYQKPAHFYLPKCKHLLFLKLLIVLGMYKFDSTYTYPHTYLGNWNVIHLNIDFRWMWWRLLAFFRFDLNSATTYNFGNKLILNLQQIQYGPTFAKGGHKECSVYNVREWGFISNWCKHPIADERLLKKWGTFK